MPHARPLQPPIPIKLLMLGAALLCWPSISDAQNNSTKKPAAQKSSAQAFSPGIEVGKKVPAIALKDQKGEQVSVQSMLQTGPVALVVYRSADW